MNGLTLRINPSNKKIKNSIGFAPITFSNDVNIKTKNQLFEEFIKSSTADEQLSITKSILDSVRNNLDKDVMSFLSLVFLQAEAKHPVKCFLARHITKNETLQQPFAEELAKEIERLITMDFSEYSQYISVVTKLAMCIENFPAGVLAIKSVEILLAEHLKNCLECCITTLSETKLSPTEKNEIYNLSHLSLRLLLFIVQKVKEDNATTLISMFTTLRSFIKYLMFDDDSPMDTKSICGILYLSMELLEKGPDAWIMILESERADKNLIALLENEAAQLSLYSAIATVVPANRIQTNTATGQSALVCLTEKIMAIGERSSSESIFILGVTRTMVQISKMLGKVSDSAGGALMELVLAFVWGHLEHYMDSVRHLAAQALANVVRYCTGLERKGDETGLNKLFAALAALDTGRKSYYVAVTSLCGSLGWARLLRRLPDVIRDVMRALALQHVQASATTALEMLIQKHTHESNTETIYSAWVLPALALVRDSAPDAAVLSILEDLMAKAVKMDENIFNYILPHIKESCAASDLRPGLMLLSVARRAAAAGRLSEEPSREDWKGIVSYDVLRRAAVDAVEETRILSLALVAESPRATERFAARELDFVLHYLRYNINAQSPNFRQLTLSLMKKFIKRLEDSHKALVRGGASGAYYCAFAAELRAQCFSGLIPGVNYSRRRVALQVLAWLGDVHLDGYMCAWNPQYVEALLLHLEDSYEANKALALHVLDAAPAQLLQGKKYRVSLDLESIIREASSLKPTDCVSAAYKLSFLKRKLPDHILQGNVCDSPEPVVFTLLVRLLEELKRQLSVCGGSVTAAARSAPMYGLLHCMGHVLEQVDASLITDDESWRALVSEMISTCVSVNAAVACVVNNSSPEGHLPMDAGGVVSDYANTGDVVLEDGRPVTAQMVLLCAWRSVKEVSLLLGTIASWLSIEGEGCGRGSLSRQQMALIGEHFTKLLAETKHRGAFEQAYVGFTRLLARLWRCRDPSLHSLPRQWLRALTGGVCAPRPARSATRRSAGLPFMIQALVTTELQVQGNPKCLHECMTTLLRLARCTALSTDQHSSNNSAPDLCDSIKSISNDLTSNMSRDSIIDTKNVCDKNATVFIKDEVNLSEKDSTINSTDATKSNEDKFKASNKPCDSTVGIKSDNEEYRDNVVETRTHSVNILRALFRNSMLEESLAGYVGEGLMVALQGFEGDTWMERNSSTLLFSALMVRVFGVTRSPRADTPALRNTMTGRIFFLRYPQLYDFIMNKLKEANSSIEEQLHPSLYPVLLLLGRLYPSSLEGAGSALRLRALLPQVVAAARSRVTATRQLAARAVVPLIAPDQYIPHLTSMFSILSDPSISRNYCHGILLQLTRLLALRPDLVPGPSDQGEGLAGTLWVLRQAAGAQPCYVLADEYVTMINLIVWRLPSFVNDEMLMTIKGYLHNIIFAENIPPITSGREVCLANCLYLYLVLLHKFSNTNELCELVHKALEHKSYEVVLSTLNYLLILYKQLDVDNCRFQQHLSKITNENVLKKLRDTPKYIEKLCKILQNNNYLECIQKTLKVLTLEKNTQKYIVGVKVGNNFDLTDEEIITQLFDCIQNEHENLTHIYLESLSNFVTDKLRDTSISEGMMLEVLRVVYACSSSENSDSSRHVVAGFMENNFEILLNLELKDISEEDKFELKSTLWATMVTILEDDDAAVRQRAADVIAVTSRAAGDVTGVTSRVVPARAAETLRDAVRARGDAAAVWVLLALLDFKSEVCMTDEISDECRVFDQNERYNIFLEECMWTRACADELASLCARAPHSARQLVLSVVDNSVYRRTLDKLCNNNIIIFRKMIHDPTTKYKYEALNPKIELFISKIC